MKIESGYSKCVFCNQRLESKDEATYYHDNCKKEVDNFQSVYGIKNPWVQFWINLLANNLNIDFKDINFKYIFSLQDLFVEIKEFTSYNKGSGLIYENLCFVKINSPTWICLKGSTAIDADNYQDWPEKEFFRMVKNYLYNPPNILRQYISTPLIQLYFPIT